MDDNCNYNLRGCMYNLQSKFQIYFFCSCYSSICRAHSILLAVCHTIVHNCVNKDCFNSFIWWIYYLYWFYEQHGPLQLWDYSQVDVLQLPSSQILDVYTLVSLLSYSSTNIYRSYPIFEEFDHFTKSIQLTAVILMEQVPFAPSHSI